MENDELGRTWGPLFADGTAEGVMRVRTSFLSGWNATTAQMLSVPLLIIRGQHGAIISANQSGLQLYNTIPGAQKLFFNVACAGHFMPWESQRLVLHHISKQWLKHAAVEGFTNGSFLVDTEGILSVAQ